MLSLPSRECGLKSLAMDRYLLVFFVTPFAGVWIEISICNGSLPVGLVTPFAGVWIEIVCFAKFNYPLARHSLRGSVD